MWLEVDLGQPPGDSFEKRAAKQRAGALRVGEDETRRFGNLAFEGEGDLVETVRYLDREGVWRSKNVTRRVLFAKRKTCITEKRQ